MKFKEFDTVRIMVGKYNDIKCNDIGVVIMAFDSPNEAYEIEIVSDDGKTIAQGAFLPTEIELA